MASNKEQNLPQKKEPAQHDTTTPEKESAQNDTLTPKNESAQKQPSKPVRKHTPAFRQIPGKLHPEIMGAFLMENGIHFSCTQNSPRSLWRTFLSRLKTGSEMCMP